LTCVGRQLTWVMLICFDGYVTLPTGGQYAFLLLYGGEGGSRCIILVLYTHWVGKVTVLSTTPRRHIRYI